MTHGRSPSRRRPTQNLNFDHFCSSTTMSTSRRRSHSTMSRHTSAVSAAPRGRFRRRKSTTGNGAASAVTTVTVTTRRTRSHSHRSNASKLSAFDPSESPSPLRTQNQPQIEPAVRSDVKTLMKLSTSLSMFHNPCYWNLDSALHGHLCLFFLSRDLFLLCSISRLWRSILSDNSRVWKNVFIRDWGGEKLLSKCLEKDELQETTWKQANQQLIQISMSALSGTSFSYVGKWDGGECKPDRAIFYFTMKLSRVDTSAETTVTQTLGIYQESEEECEQRVQKYHDKKESIVNKLSMLYPDDTKDIVLVDGWIDWKLISGPEWVLSHPTLRGWEYVIGYYHLTRQILELHGYAIGKEGNHLLEKDDYQLQLDSTGHSFIGVTRSHGPNLWTSPICASTKEYQKNVLQFVEKNFHQATDRAKSSRLADFPSIFPL